MFPGSKSGSSTLTHFITATNMNDFVGGLSWRPFHGKVPAFLRNREPHVSLTEAMSVFFINSSFACTKISRSTAQLVACKEPSLFDFVIVGGSLSDVGVERQNTRQTTLFFICSMYNLCQHDVSSFSKQLSRKIRVMPPLSAMK